MNLEMAIIYGVIQGVTEFLPISSSGHLALLPLFFNIEDPGIFFDLAMHMGTALAVFIYFFKDIILLFKRRDHLFNLIITTGITLVLAWFVNKFTGYGRNPTLISINLLIFGIFMWLADSKGPKPLSGFSKAMTETKQLRRSVIIGTFQVLALFPGVSRSGVTMAVSRLVGLSRKEAARYSFLLSFPLIVSGFFYKLQGVTYIEDIFIKHCLIGAGFAFITGLLSIHFFLKIIQRMGLWIFALYRILLAVLIMIIL